LVFDDVMPDCEFLGADGGRLENPALHYIHRTSAAAEIYFVASRTNTPRRATVTFRTAGRVPELWNAVTGARQFAAAYRVNSRGHTFVPLDFAPYGSWFVIFRKADPNHAVHVGSNSPAVTPLVEIAGAWTVRFDTNWGGPAEVQFDSLVSWPERAEPGIKFFSGLATYEKTFELPQSATGNRPSAILLDLGNVRELAEVKVNGKSCGITWAPPFRVNISEAVQPGVNKLEIEVVNFWPNRLIGDASLPQEQRLTRTNIRKLTKDTKLMEAGLLGPVRILGERVP
jgi:hypothetical protein